MSKKLTKATLAEIRTAVADYIQSEGCACCENKEEHAQAQARLAEFLNVPKYEDGSGFDFHQFRTGKKKS